MVKASSELTFGQEKTPYFWILIRKRTKSIIFVPEINWRWFWLMTIICCHFDPRALKEYLSGTLLLREKSQTGNSLRLNRAVSFDCHTTALVQISTQYETIVISFHISQTDSGIFSVRFWRQYVSLCASITAIVSLLLTSDRKVPAETVV